MRYQGNTETAVQSMALNPDQVYRIGASVLGWDSSTAAGKALIAEDMKLLKRLQLVNAKDADGAPPTLYRIGHGG